MKLLALDLAKNAGYCWAEDTETPLLRQVQMPGSGATLEIRTFTRILDSGTLALGEMETPETEGGWLLQTYHRLVDFLRAYPSDLVVLEFPRWLRGASASTRGITTTFGLRAAFLMAAADCEMSARLVQIDPRKWQDPIIGRGKRAGQKEKSLAAAQSRLGLITKDNNISDAALIADYILTCLRVKGEI